MNFEIGKVIKYENKEGIILTKNGNKYMFLEKDIKTGINNRDLVIFRPEIINGANRAYFVKKLNIYMNNKKNKDNIKRYFKVKDLEV